MSTQYRSVTFVLCTAVIVGVMFSLSVQSSTAAGFATSGQFDQVTTVSLARMSLRLVQSITFKDQDIRVDADDPTQMIPITNIETPDEVYLYSPLMPNGQKQPITDKRPVLLARMDSDTKAKLATATKTGTDTCEGYNCDVYSTTENNGQETIKFWVSTDPEFPFTLKTIATDLITQKTTTVELQNINLNGPIDPALFQVPTDIKFTVPAAPPPSTTGATGQSPSAVHTTTKTSN